MFKSIIPYGCLLAHCRIILETAVAQSSRQFTGFPARRDAEAASMLLGGPTTLGSRETCVGL